MFYRATSSPHCVVPASWNLVTFLPPSYSALVKSFAGSVSLRQLIFNVWQYTSGQMLRLPSQLGFTTAGDEVCEK